MDPDLNTGPRFGFPIFLILLTTGRGNGYPEDIKMFQAKQNPAPQADSPPSEPPGKPTQNRILNSFFKKSCLTPSKIAYMFAVFGLVFAEHFDY